MSAQRYLRHLALAAASLLLCLTLAACGAPSGVSDSQEQDLPISVDNDSVETGTSPTVTDTEAGKVIRSTQSEGTDMEAGSTAAPAPSTPDAP
jgi:hypothetical protein